MYFLAVPVLPATDHPSTSALVPVPSFTTLDKISFIISMVSALTTFRIGSGLDLKSNSPLLLIICITI